jgi:DNA invertase Pin-like site-specific DNA recombinase
MRVGLYCRVSTSSRSRYGEAIAFDQRPELQEDALRRAAEQRGWKVVVVYSDRISGGKSKRPGLDAVLSDARRGRFDVLMVWRFDRLSRSAIHFLQVVDELQNLKVDFVSLEQSLDTTTPMGKFVLTMFAALAELHRSIIRDNVIAGLEYAKKHGTKSGRPIGRPRRIFDKETVVTLRDEGLSWSKIASKLGLGVGTVVRAYGSRTNAMAVRQNPIAGGLETRQEGN